MGYTFKRPDPAAMERILTRFPYSPEGAILRLAWLEGLSREEIAALTWDQVQFEDNALTLPDLRPGHDKSAGLVAKDQQGVSRRDAVKPAGFLGDHDLSPVTHLGGAEDPVFTLT